MNSLEKWIPIKTRPLTEEEKEEWYTKFEEYDFVYDCEIPEHNQEVLITTKDGFVVNTIFCTDMGCYFEGYEEEDDVLAWMPLPEPYKEEGGKNDNR